MWKSVKNFISQHQYLNESDTAIFAREYTPGQGYQAGETNQLISNFKKCPTTKNTPQWYYREKAIEKFSTEFASLIKGENSKSLFVTSIPSSKMMSDPLYDRRFEDLFAFMKHSCHFIQDCWPVMLNTSVTPAHLGGSRDPSIISGNYQWRGFKKDTPEELWVFDDILTTGAHFRSYSDFCRNNGYSGKIIGVFWARCL